MAHINNLNSALTGSEWVAPGCTKAGFDPGDFSTRDVIDAPEWVPTGGHELYELNGSGWTHLIVFGEHSRAGRVYL